MSTLTAKCTSTAMRSAKIRILELDSYASSGSWCTGCYWGHPSCLLVLWKGPAVLSTCVEFWTPLILFPSWGWDTSWCGYPLATTFRCIVRGCPAKIKGSWMIKSYYSATAHKCRQTIKSNGKQMAEILRIEHYYWVRFSWQPKTKGQRSTSSRYELGAVVASRWFRRLSVTPLVGVTEANDWRSTAKPNLRQIGSIDRGITIFATWVKDWSPAIVLWPPVTTNLII